MTVSVSVSVSMIARVRVLTVACQGVGRTVMHNAGTVAVGRHPDLSACRCVVVSMPTPVNVSMCLQPLIVQETLPTVSTHSSPGGVVYDLGKNFAGWPAVTVFGDAGASVRLVCGELMQTDGTPIQDGSPQVAPRSHRVRLCVSMRQFL